MRFATYVRALFAILALACVARAYAFENPDPNLLAWSLATLTVWAWRRSEFG